MGRGGRGGAGMGGLPCPFLKIKKIALILLKKVLIVSILKLNLSFKWRKNSEIFPTGLSFIEFLTKFLLKCPNFTNFLISGCAPALSPIILSMAQLDCFQSCLLNMQFSRKTSLLIIFLTSFGNFVILLHHSL